MINSPVLVLNQSYEPLNLCRTRRAIVLIFRGKAEVLENNRGELHSANQVFDIPSVIRLVYMVSRPRHQRKLSRSEVFSRDQNTCQYCGRQTKELTLDHVIRGGGVGSTPGTMWLVPAFLATGTKATMPDEARMKLLRQPGISSQ